MDNDLSIAVVRAAAEFLHFVLHDGVPSLHKGLLIEKMAFFFARESALRERGNRDAVRLYAAEVTLLFTTLKNL